MMKSRVIAVAITSLVLVSASACKTTGRTHGRTDNDGPSVESGAAPAVDTTKTTLLGPNTAELEQAEINAVISIFNRAHVPDTVENTDCSSSSAVIEKPVAGSASPVWYLRLPNSKKILTDDESVFMSSMFNRLQVPATLVTVKGQVCNTGSSNWTATFSK
ncbi:MAG: hypothetical protein H7249_12715 [Chitinophagaceae bacterium]|nr:hypothetical protein [Oligoflexus sp.]